MVPSISATCSSTSGISGCVTNECAPRSAFHLRGRRARHADHAESAATGRETGRNDRGDEPEHQQDFAGFGISYDNYHSTHSDENRELSTLIYSRLKENGFIKNRTISQLYDPEKGMFLPDRFVKGTCPKCKSPDQYGDNCEVCGATYSPTELIDPKSVVSGATPVMRDSEHFFFDLPAFSEMLQAWTRSGALQEQVANKMQEWFESGLQQWDISRDAPYFGFGSRMRRANTSTSGWTRRSATWAPSRTCATSAAIWTSTSSGVKTPPPSCITLSAGHRLLPQPVLAGDAGR